MYTIMVSFALYFFFDVSWGFGCLWVSISPSTPLLTFLDTFNHIPFDISFGLCLLSILERIFCPLF